MTLKEAVDAYKRKLIQEAWLKYDGCIKQICDELGVSRKTLWSIRKTLGLLGNAVWELKGENDSSD